MARKGGVLHRAGHTEAGCDLARLAGLEPAAVICEIIKEDGEMARRADLEVFAAEHGLKIGTIADLIHYRMTNEQTVELIDSREFDSEFGQFTLHRFQEYGASEIHIALTKGEPSEGVATVRVHSLNPLRDLLGASDSTTGKSGWDIRAALKEISQNDRGVFVWIDNGAPVDLSDALDKCKANNSIHEAQEPYRSIGVGAQILRLLGVRDMRLLSSPAKFNVSGFDLNIVESVAAPK